MKTIYLRTARWLLVVLGSVLVGGGLVLHAQVAVARYLRDEIDGTFFLWRAIGRLTFAFQDSVTQTAFAVKDIPKGVLIEADRGAWVLVVIGGVVALLSFVIRVPDRTKVRGRP